jgi:hypothetical protein
MPVHAGWLNMRAGWLALMSSWLSLLAMLFVYVAFAGYDL